jgi:hypothetical protein
VDGDWVDDIDHWRVTVRMRDANRRPADKAGVPLEGDIDEVDVPRDRLVSRPGGLS